MLSNGPERIAGKRRVQKFYRRRLHSVHLECTNCGRHPIAEDALFCDHCGARFYRHDPEIQNVDVD